MTASELLMSPVGSMQGETSGGRTGNADKLDCTRRAKICGYCYM